ncbi:MAG: iron export ABC transporter permease subunit FetB [Comamonas sp.]
MNNTIQLQFSDLLMGAALVLAAAGASWAMRLQLQRQVLWASLRMVVQLLLVGYVLRLVFQHASPFITLLVVCVMIAAAAREVAVRPHQQLAHGGNYRIAGLVVSLASLSTVLLALLTAVRPEPWFDARYAIPLMGIVLGSVLNSASLGLDSFYDSVRQGRAAIEAQLALGTTIRQALASHTRAAIRRGLIPIINQMSAAGLITLPGIMTGQILGGMDPLEAAKYQILLLFLLTAAGGMAAASSVLLAARALTDERQRLRLDRLQKSD